MAMPLKLESLWPEAGQFAWCPSLNETPESQTKKIKQSEFHFDTEYKLKYL